MYTAPRTIVYLAILDYRFCAFVDFNIGHEVPVYITATHDWVAVFHDLKSNKAVREQFAVCYGPCRVSVEPNSVLTLVVDLAVSDRATAAVPDLDARLGVVKYFAILDSGL